MAWKRASASSAVDPLARRRNFTCDGGGAWPPGKVVLQVAAKQSVISVVDGVVGAETGVVEAVVAADVAGSVVDDDAGVSASDVATSTVDVDAVVLVSAFDAAAFDAPQSSQEEEPSCSTAAEYCGHSLNGSGINQQCGGRMSRGIAKPCGASAASPAKIALPPSASTTMFPSC